jgi:hypothetical protein
LHAVAPALVSATAGIPVARRDRASLTGFAAGDPWLRSWKRVDTPWTKGP